MKTQSLNTTVLRLYLSQSTEQNRTKGFSPPDIIIQ